MIQTISNLETMDYTNMFPTRVCYSGGQAIPFRFAQVQPTSSIKPRQRRNRTQFREWQIHILEKTYLKSNYIDVEQRDKLSHDLNLIDSNIKVWFQNRRTKARREGKQEPIMPSQEPRSEETPRPIMARTDRKKTAGRVPPPPLSLPIPVKEVCRPRSSAKECCCCTYSPYLPGPLQLPYLLPLSSFPLSPAFSPGVSPGFSGMFQFPPLSLPFISGSRSIDGTIGSCADLKYYEQR